MAEQVLDQGLQAERTALAWSRTALGVFVNALLLLRAGVVEHRWEPAAIGLLLLGAAGLTQAFSLARRRVLLQDGHVGAVPAEALLALAMLTVVCSAGALFAILSEIGHWC